MRNSNVTQYLNRSLSFDALATRNELGVDLLQLASLDVVDESSHRNILTNKVRLAVGCNVVLDALRQICKGR